jgi:hypothetical protein
MFENPPAFLRTMALWTTLAGVSISAVGCRSEAEIAQEEARNEAVRVLRETQANEKFIHEVAQVAKDGETLVHETAYVLELKMAKEQLTLDPFKHIGNELKAQYRDIIVGEKEFGQRKIGETISSEGDFIGFLDKGAFSSYVVCVHRKSTIDHFRYLDSSGNSHEVSQAVFNAGLDALKNEGKQLYRTHGPGKESWQVLEHPITAGDIDHIAPMNRYYADVTIANSSFSLSLIKHLRNATTAHRFTVEIPEKAYLEQGTAFDSRMSDSIFLSGRMSSLSGTINKKWSERDESAFKVTLKDGRKVVMAADQIPRK